MRLAHWTLHELAAFNHRRYLARSDHFEFHFATVAHRCPTIASLAPAYRAARRWSTLEALRQQVDFAGACPRGIRLASHHSREAFAQRLEKLVETLTLEHLGQEGTAGT